MKTILKLAFLLALLTIAQSKAQTWKELMDSAYHYKDNGGYNLALVFALQAIPQSEKEFGFLDTNSALTLHETGKIYYYLQKIDSSIYYEDEANRILTKFYSKDHKDKISSLISLSFYYSEINDFNKAESYGKEAIDMGRRISNEEPEILLESLNNMATLYNNKGNYKSAESLYNEALVLSQNLYKSDNNNHAKLLNDVAIFYKHLGLYNKSETLLRESIEIRNRLIKGDDQNKIITTTEYANVLLQLGKYSEAENLYFEALTSCRRLFKSEHSITAYCLNHLGSYYYKLDRLDEAEKYLLDALNMRKKLNNNDNVDLANSLHNMAIFYMQSDNFKEAEKYFHEELKMKQNLYKGDHPDLISTIKGMAVYYEQLGDYQKAENLFIDAISMCRRIFQEDNNVSAQNLFFLARFYFQREEYDKALKYAKESRDILVRISGLNSQEMINLLQLISSIYSKMGEYQKANDHFIQYINLANEIYKNNPIRRSYVMNSSALYHFRKGDITQAEKDFTESLTLFRKYFKCHPDLIRLLHNLVMLYDRQGNFKDALNTYREIFEIVSTMIKNIFPIQSEKEKLLFYTSVYKYFENYCSFSSRDTMINSNQSGDALSLLLNTRILLKSMILNSSKKFRSQILTSKDSTIIANYYNWLKTREYFSKLSATSAEGLKNRQVNLDSLEEIINDLEKRLNRNFKCSIDGDKNINFVWQDLQKILSDEAIVEIVRFNYSDTVFHNNIYYLALIVSNKSKGHPDMVLLKNGNDLEGKYIEEYRNQAGQFKKRVYDPDKVNGKLKELYSQFWAQIQEKLKGIKTVYFSPDGVYNLLNLNTLINPETGKYLLEEIDLRLVTSTRDLVEIDTPLNPLSRGENIAELFGDPQFDLDSTKYELLVSNIRSNTTREYYSLANTLDSATRGAISPLPGTRKEIENIDGSFQKQGWKVNRHLGPEALEEALKALDNPRVLHIATHGKFLKDVERRDDVRMMGFETQRFVENPLLRSMLLFSGAENTLLNQGQHSATQREDGLLTAYEAQNLNLDNTELVVLSACETGLGEVKNGEGVYGLQRAFQVAGAKSLIMSLWSVSDEATQELMTSFYSKWLGGKSKREAFREAQMELKKKYPGFYYWGAFVMVGE